MSISSEISRISQNVSDSLTAVAAKGATVPSGSNSDDLPTLIASLPSTNTVTYSLTNGASASVTPSRVVNSQGFSVKLKAPAGYNLSNVSVTMGGVDITSTAFEPDESGGGGGGTVTITDEANATGITCVITTSGGGGGDDPTPSGIPLNEELIDYTATSSSTEINEYGQAVSADAWYYASDYTAIDPSMTFSFTGAQWCYLAVYDSSKTFVRSLAIDDIKDSASNNIAYGTLSGSRITGGYYVRITAIGNTSNALSLIRTA